MAAFREDAHVSPGVGRTWVGGATVPISIGTWYDTEAKTIVVSQGNYFALRPPTCGGKWTSAGTKQVQDIPVGPSEARMFIGIGTAWRAHGVARALAKDGGAHR